MEEASAEILLLRGSAPVTPRCTSSSPLLWWRSGGRRKKRPANSSDHGGHQLPPEVTLPFWLNGCTFSNDPRDYRTAVLKMEIKSYLIEDNAYEKFLTLDHPHTNYRRSLVVIPSI